MTTTAPPLAGSPDTPPTGSRPAPTASAPHRPPLDGRDPAEPPPGRRRAEPVGPGGGAAHPAGGEVVIADPAELVAAVPALLGFHPNDSLVLLSIGGSGTGRGIGLTLRVDLPPRSTSRAEFRALARDVVEMLLRDRPRAAVVLVLAPAGGTDLPHRHLVEAVTVDLRAHEVRLLSAVWAESTAGGARWGCYPPCGCRGIVPGPESTALAARTVFEGRVVHSSRDAVARALDPVDRATLDRRERMLLDADGSGVLEVPPEAPAAALAVVDEAIADAADGALVLDDARVVALARALAATPVRDGALVRCLGPAAPAAEQLWAALVREVPEPEAAEPAALLAACALLRGDGALATIALDRAERAWPGHRLAGLLRALVASAVPPRQVREMLRDSLVGLPGARRSVRRAGGGSARRPRRRRPSC